MQTKDAVKTGVSELEPAETAGHCGSSDDTSTKLTAEDLATFGNFGIDERLLKMSKVQRVTDREAREIYGIRFTSNLDLSGIMFPYFDPVAGHRVSARLRRDHPDIDANGNAKNKYLSPYGDNPHLFFPPGANSLLTETSVPVVFVEAEKSSLAITALAGRTQRRFLPVGTGGCCSWSGKVGIRELPTGPAKRSAGHCQICH